MEIEGYEIHMGRTTESRNKADVGCFHKDLSARGAFAADSNCEGSNYMDSCRSDCFCRIQDHRTGIETPDGTAAGNIYGTYVHGIFDAPGIARRIVEVLAEHKGVTMNSSTENPQNNADETDYQAYKETQYDLLAETLRRHLDMKRIYEILEES